MPAERLSVVVTRRLPEPVETRMKELFDVELRDPDTKMTREELAAAMQRADVLVPTITDQIDASLIVHFIVNSGPYARVAGFLAAVERLVGRHEWLQRGRRPATGRQGRSGWLRGHGRGDEKICYRIAGTGRGNRD